MLGDIFLANYSQVVYNEVIYVFTVRNNSGDQTKEDKKNCSLHVPLIDIMKKNTFKILEEC
jgi:hypothetical protein